MHGYGTAKVLVIGHICHPACFQWKILCKQRCGTSWHFSHPHNAIHLANTTCLSLVEQPWTSGALLVHKVSCVHLGSRIRRNGSVTLVLPCWKKPSESSKKNGDLGIPPTNYTGPKPIMGIPFHHPKHSKSPKVHQWTCRPNPKHFFYLGA